jgi:hypothetical protein
VIFNKSCGPHARHCAKLFVAEVKNLTIPERIHTEMEMTDREVDTFVGECYGIICHESTKEGRPIQQDRVERGFSRIFPLSSRKIFPEKTDSTLFFSYKLSKSSM